jgi:hypothetical protein
LAKLYCPLIDGKNDKSIFGMARGSSHLNRFSGRAIVIRNAFSTLNSKFYKSFRKFQFYLKHLIIGRAILSSKQKVMVNMYRTDIRRKFY